MTFYRLAVSPRVLASGLSLSLLAGCATFSPDGGLDTVQNLTRPHTGTGLSVIRTDADVASVETQLTGLLGQPLTPSTAVQIALLNNRSLQAGYAELGIAEADLVQAGRLANPVFSFSRLKSGDGVEIERKLMLPVIDLLTMPIATRLEQRRFEQAQLRTAADVLRIADETRRAYFGAVAALQSAEYLNQVALGAEASAELARRMLAAGNWSALQQAREQAVHADAVAQLARARQASIAERERLVRLMGLKGGAIAFTLPDRLPELPAAPRAIADAEAQAMTNRIDILMAQKELAGLAASLGLTRATRFVNLLDLSYLNNSTESGARPRGYEIELQIPLFDWGGARVAKAEALYMQAVHRAASAAIDARSQVRESYGAYQTAYVIARQYRDEIVPLKKRISDQQLLRYNGMLISVFELLADAREQVISVNAAIEAQRDYWIADSALQAALTGGGSGAVTLGAGAAPAAAPSQH
jgi:outer membrane protein TolC